MVGKAWAKALRRDRVVTCGEWVDDLGARLSGRGRCPSIGYTAIHAQYSEVGADFLPALQMTNVET